MRCSSLFALLSGAADDRVDIPLFTQGDLSSWQPKVFSGKTRYSLKSSNGLFALHAEGMAAASGLYRTVNVELDKTLMLNWTWKVDNVLAGADERIRAGNDYSACVYVGFSGGTRF